jgi:membrane-bound lytic murein transglycosylase D
MLAKISTLTNQAQEWYKVLKIMSAKASNVAIVLAIIGLLSIGGCSSSPKPAAKPKVPASSTAGALGKGQSVAAQTPAAAEATKTSIPAKEIEPVPAPPENPPQEKPAADKNDPAAQISEAFTACQEAEALREKGDFDAALTTLDKAYALLLRVELPPDSPLLQEKGDLRLMIAKTIQTIHASRIVPPKENHKTIPLAENKYVLQEITSFQTVERRSFEDSYERAGLYRDMVAQEFRQTGIPEELSWLPMIESSFKVRALSRARALGLWQFISSTALLYDLKQDRYIDERMDPLKETRAAAKYLSDLHNLFGDWTTALAAYNCGEYGVQRVISSQQIDYLDNFWDLFAKLPYETARFVPRFIASLLIINNPEKYGFTLPTPYPSLKYETVKVDYATKLSSLSTNLGLDPSELAFLNPELRYDATPDYDYELKVPVGYVDRASQAIATLPKWVPPETTYVIHYVKSGETLGLIAKRYHTTVTAIVHLNGLKSSRFIRPGWELKVPGRGAASASGTVILPDKPPAVPAAPSIPAPSDASIGNTYTVVAGDTPFAIAKKYGLTLEEFLAINNLTADSILVPGQVVIIKKK